MSAAAGFFRVFPDSNILIEGLFAPWSASRAILILARTRAFRLVLSPYVEAEVERALLTRLARDPAELHRAEAEPRRAAHPAPFFAASVKPAQGVASEQAADQSPHFARGFITLRNGRSLRPQRFNGEPQQVRFLLGKRRLAGQCAPAQRLSGFMRRPRRGLLHKCAAAGRTSLPAFVFRAGNEPAGRHQ